LSHPCPQSADVPPCTLSDSVQFANSFVFAGEVAGTTGSWGGPDERKVTYRIGRSYRRKGIATRALDAVAIEVVLWSAFVTRCARRTIRRRRERNRIGCKYERRARRLTSTWRSRQRKT
jgi:hypothetical protein